MVELIAMLTHNDKTVTDARAVFAAAADAPTLHWGFKDTGLPLEELALLAADMKQAGKSVHFESLEEDEDRCIAAARFAVDQDFDFLIGMAYHRSVADILAEAGVRYLPTCGARSGLPRLLHGSIDEVIKDALLIRPASDGLALSLYRWTDGVPAQLGERFLDEVPAPVVITGSINSRLRLEGIRRLSPWAITVGSALFDDAFGTGTFGDGLTWMRLYLDSVPTDGIIAG